MQCRPSVIVGILIVVAVTSAPLPAQIDAEIFAWSSAVRHHQPGTADAAAQELAGWSWRRLEYVLGRFFGSKKKTLDTALLLRAAAAYGDMALFIPRERRPIYPGTKRITLAQDGRTLGPAWMDSHLRVAHELVERIVRSQHATDADKTFAADWYLAVAAALAGVDDLAGLRDHLQSARNLFPDNSEVHFVSGCLAETIASPAVQAAIEASGRPAGEKPASQTKTIELLYQRFLTRSGSLADADTHFRSALSHDPGHREARVRLAHILILKDRPEEALRTLDASHADEDTTVQYYEALIRGRAFERLQRLADARGAFANAERVFPAAQSPAIALSRLAALEGDSDAARMRLERALSGEAAHDEDPWWVYHRCSGREAKRIYTTFMGRVRQLPISAGMPTP